MTERENMDTLFTSLDDRQLAKEAAPERKARRGKPNVKAWAISLLTLTAVAAGVIAGPEILSPPAPPKAVPAPSSVAVSVPLERDLADRLELLGQFSPMQEVELRPQVGGTLTQIGFKDGAIVHEGDLLFQIDPTPYEIRWSSAKSQLEGAKSRLELANQEFFRATRSGRPATAASKQPTSARRSSGQPEAPSTTPRRPSATHSSTSIMPALSRRSRAALAVIRSQLAT